MNRPSARRVLLLGTVLALLAGVVLGAVWWWLAPLARASVVDGNVYLSGYQELQAAQDGWFAVVLGLAGVALATVQALRTPRRELLRTVVALGAIALAAVVAWKVGELLGPGPLAAQVDAGSRRPLTPLQLRTPAAILVGPFLFAVTRCLAALFSRETPTRRATMAARLAPGSRALLR